jgi:hypothetical protein
MSSTNTKASPDDKLPENASTDKKQEAAKNDDKSGLTR